MRLRKADLRARVNAPLVLRFRARGLTSFAGLELLRRYFVSLELAGRIRRLVEPRLPATDYGRTAMVLVLLTLIIVGGRRLRHLMYLEGDPLVLRMSGLGRLPTARTTGRWIEQIDGDGLDGMRKLNEELVAEVIRASDLRRLTIDVDGSVVSTGLKVEGARRGFNPHHRKVPSYYPITAHEAQTGQVLRVENRPGNVHDGKGSLEFLAAVFEQVGESLGGGYLLEFRMDGAFFRRDVIDLLDANGAEYAIKVPFYEWVGLKPMIAARESWRKVDEGVDSFQQWVRMEPWERWMRVVVFRKRVGHMSSDIQSCEIRRHPVLRG